MSASERGRTDQRAINRRLYLYVVLLFALTASVVVACILWGLAPRHNLPIWCLPFLAGGLIAAEVLRVRFRRGEYVDAVTLFEAVLAPLVFAYDAPTAVVTVAVAQIATGVIRRHPPVKLAFNVSQWMLAAGAGSAVANAVRGDETLGLRTLAALVLAMFVVALINNLAVMIVLAIVEEQPFVEGVKGLRPVMGSAWIGWIINLLFGLLFIMASAGNPVAVVLFPVPLFLLHIAYKGYAAARADGQRLSALQQAAHALSEPLDPRAAIPSYLAAVRECFEAQAAVLVLRDDNGEWFTYLQAAPAEDGTDDQSRPRGRPASMLEVKLAELSTPARIDTGSPVDLRDPLLDAGRRGCLSAPLVDDAQQLGVVAVLDQAGLEGTRSSELVVLEALARETAHTLARGRLLENVMHQERRLNQIISTTSDGIFTMADDGTLLTWNAACEQITGYDADDVVGRRDLMRSLEARTGSGKPVNFGNWISLPTLPRDLLITTRSGGQRRLSCSATTATDADGERSLVVIARDITPADEYEELREQFSQLVEAQAAQRLVVDHLQQAVAPEPPGIDGADIAVRYVASDPTSPTGGDLFDWYRLPSGELHIAVVDVLGHGVVATKDALTVVHTLRFSAVEGTPLEEIVTRADALLTAQDSDLVATVVVARYKPETGELRIVSGGHPPALVVGPGGEVTPVSATGGAIGWPAVGSDNVATVQLGVHDSLILYTDGLIEARKDIIEGMDSLLAVAADVAHLPAQHFADELVRRSLSGADRRDDTLALVLRRTRKSVVADRIRWRLDPSEQHGLRRVRKELNEWLAAHQVEQEDVVLVAAELLANGKTAARSTVVLNAFLETGQVIVEVSDDGPGTDTLQESGRKLPGSESERGRGLYLVRALSEDVTAMSTAEGTVVRATVHVSGITTSARRLHSPT